MWSLEVVNCDIYALWGLHVHILFVQTMTCHAHLVHSWWDCLRITSLVFRIWCRVYRPIHHLLRRGQVTVLGRSIYEGGLRLNFCNLSSKWVIHVSLDILQCFITRLNLSFLWILVEHGRNWGHLLRLNQILINRQVSIRLLHILYFSFRMLNCVILACSIRRWLLSGRVLLRLLPSDNWTLVFNRRRLVFHGKIVRIQLILQIIQNINRQGNNIAGTISLTFTILSLFPNINLTHDLLHLLPR